MLKFAVLLPILGVVLAFAVPSKPIVPSGRWTVDRQHSDAQLVTDATTNYGKDKINFAVGVTRVTGRVKLDNENPAQSAFDISLYPATAMAPPMGEDGKVKAQWLANLANNTLICFHSKGTTLTYDGRLRTTGALVLTRVDRNVIYETNEESYSGPVYGPPIIHRITHQATFVFDAPAAPAGSKKDPELVSSGSTKVVTEDFPQLFKAVMATYWPPVVQDENCTMPSVVGEDFSGPHCTGNLIHAPGLPEEPHGTSTEDYPSTNTGFNAVVGNNVTIAVHLHLKPAPAESHADAGN